MALAPMLPWLLSVAAATQQTPVPARPQTAAEWRAAARTDLDAYATAARENYIYAVYPHPAQWRAQFARHLAAVKAKLPLVRDEAGYQALLRYLAATFEDAHVSVRFAAPPLDTTWAGFLARFDNGVYRTTAVHPADAPGVRDGAPITACDGKPISWWIDAIARYEVGLPVALETTRMSAALRLFVDRGSPLRPSPTRCTIDGRQVTLRWSATPTREIDPIVAAWQGRVPAEVNTHMIGDDGAWVRLGYFDPESAAQADAFRAAITTAPTLRDKRFIILDVRHNGGGPYNWFMAYLRSLYGQPYADYYATARLHVHAVYRIAPAITAMDRQAEAQSSDFGQPADPPNEINAAADAQAERQAIAAGAPFYRKAPIAITRGAPPPDPVRAKVYVLTDYACASACIAFVDEMKLFPGVTQIGLPTIVDSRSGTPVTVALPSGLATAWLASMTRDGRIRDDNSPQAPSIRYPGDIRDDQAIENWVLTRVVAKGG